MVCLSVILLCYRITCWWFCNKRVCNLKRALFVPDSVYQPKTAVHFHHTSKIFLIVLRNTMTSSNCSKKIQIEFSCCCHSRNHHHYYFPERALMDLQTVCWSHRSKYFLNDSYLSFVLANLMLANPE